MLFRWLVLIAISFVLVSGCSSRKNIEAHDGSQNPDWQASYEHAKSLLDSWQGEQSILTEAKNELDLVAASEPDFLPARVELARYRIMLYSTIRDPEQLNAALDLLQSATQEDPTYVKPYVLLGHLYLVMRRTGESAAALTQAERIGTDDPWLHLNFADLYEKTGRRDQAVERGLIALQLNNLYPKAIAAALSFVYANGNSVDQKRAESILDQMLQTQEMSCEELYELANRIIRSWNGQRNRLKAAAIVLDKLGQDYPDYYGTYVAGARLILQSGYRSESGPYSRYNPDVMEAADGLLNHALLLNPDNIDVRFDIADLYFNSGRVEQAEAILADPFIADLPDSRVCVLRGRILQAQNKSTAAIEQYEKAVDMATNTKATLEARGLLTDIYAKVGRLDDAEAIYLQAIEAAPDSAWNYGNYAAFLLNKRNNPEKAIEYAQKALSIMNYGLARSTLADAKFRLQYR